MPLAAGGKVKIVLVRALGEFIVVFEKPYHPVVNGIMSALCCEGACLSSGEEERTATGGPYVNSHAVPRKKQGIAEKDVQSYGSKTY